MKKELIYLTIFVLIIFSFLGSNYLGKVIFPDTVGTPTTISPSRNRANFNYFMIILTIVIIVLILIISHYKHLI